MAFGETGSAGAAGYGTVDEVSTEILNTGGTSVWIKCRSSSSNSLLVNIPLIHGSDTWLILEAGDTFIGRFGYYATMVVNAKALDNSNEASLSWGLSAMYA